MLEHEQRWQASGLSPPLPKQTCTFCNELRSLNDFYKKGNRFDSQCKRCIRAKKKLARKKRLKKHLTGFQIEFSSEPDKRLLAERLSTLLEPSLL